MRGLKENTMRGFWNGGVSPFGYKFEFVKVGPNTKRRLAINNAEVGIVQDIFAMSLKGEGQKDIAKTLNRKGIFKRTGKPWTNSTIGYILNNPVYTGNLYWQEARHNPQAEKPVITVPNTHPAIIPEHVFKQTRKKIHGRTRQVINPRVLASKHLLSGLLKCKKCGALMTPLGAKSGKFHYYTCQTYLKSGRDYCSQKMIPAKKIEPFIAASIKEKILTEENIKQLYHYILDESRVFEDAFRQKETKLDALLNEKLARRAKLYEGIETAVFDLSDISPRLKDLNAEITLLEKQKSELSKQEHSGNAFSITEEELRPHVRDLHETLFDGSIIQRRGFIRSFIKRIEVDYPEATIEYTVPVPTKIKDRTSTKEVLSLKQNGVPNLTLGEFWIPYIFNWL